MRVLQVVHGFPPAATGGTEVYVGDLALALASLPSTKVAVLTREADPQRSDCALRTSAAGPVTVCSINNTFGSSASFADSYQNLRLLGVANRVLDDLEPDVVHIQHLTCLSTWLPREAARRGIPVVLTLNDYWLLCHRGQLFDLDGRACAGPLDGDCVRCIPARALAGAGGYAAGQFVRSLPIPGASRAVQLAMRAVDGVRSPSSTRAAMEQRLCHMREALSHVDCYLAPSRTMFDWFRRFGVPAERMRRCDQGISLTPFSGFTRSPSAKLRIAFAGGMIPSKAPHVLLDALAQLPASSVIVDLLGDLGPYHGQSEYATALSRRLGHPAIRRLGPVPHERMPAVLHDVDVVVVPSMWIENAPFIIREAFAARAPVVASDLGGMAEMVSDGRDGLLFPAGNAPALADCLRRLQDEPGLLERLREGITAPPPITGEAATLRQLYVELGSRRRSSTSRRPHVSCASPVPRVAAVILNYRTPEQTWLAARSLQTAFTPPADILVVDNGSDDGSAAALRNSLHGVEVIETGRNLGFSGGSNAGIRTALERPIDYVLLVNSDVVLAPDAIDNLLAAMASDDTVGIAGPLLLSRERPGLIASAGIVYSRRTGRMRQRGAGRTVASLGVAPGQVNAVSGCVMLIRRSVLEQSGLLDDEYFFSFEDIEFCLRAADHGWRSICVMSAVAYHEGGRTIGRRSSRRVYFATRNHLRLQAKAGVPRPRLLSAAAVIALNAAYVIASPEAPFFRGIAALARGAWHHARGRYGAY